MKRVIMYIFVLIFLAQTAHAQSGYKLTKTFHIASTGGWDYITVDPTSNRLYVSHGTQVNILDKITGDSLGVIPNTTGAHGIALVNSINKGYTSNGRLNNVSVFDLKTNAVMKQIPTGENPDAIFYEPVSKKIITCNGRSKDLTIIDVASEQVVATIAVGGKPETAVSDEAGKVFVNIEDKNEILAIDINKNETSHWALNAESPTGLAIDVASKRLFAGCEKTLVVMDATNGKVITTIPIGEGCDGVAFDSKSKLIFTSNGSGTMSVIKEVSKNKFELVENVVSKKGARTICEDQSTGAVYMPTAEFEPQAPGEKGRPKIILGSFQIIVFQKSK